MANRPLRVAWDNSLARRNPTGGGVYATQLIRELNANPAVELKVFEGWDSARAAGEFGNQGMLARAKRGLNGLLWSHTYFPYMVHKEKIDVVHSPTFTVPLLSPCPSVATIHDLTHLIFPHHFEARWRTYLDIIMPWVLRSASAVICISEHTRQDLLKAYKVSPEKLYVVYHGIDHERFHPAARLDLDWAASIGLNRDYVLHVGTLSFRKNIPMLLQAMARLRKQREFENFQLVLAGPEVSVLTGLSEIHDTVRELELEKTVIFTGQISDALLPGLYAQAKLLAFPSLYEGFGLPILESMAAGTPVIVSNTSCLPEIAGDAAVLLRPDDPDLWANAMQEVLESPAKAEELRRKGLQRASEFSWERAADQTLAVYRSVAKP